MGKWFGKNYKYLPIGWVSKAYKALGWEYPDKVLSKIMHDRSDAGLVAQAALGTVGGLASTGAGGATFLGSLINKLFKGSGSSSVDPDDPDYDELLGESGQSGSSGNWLQSLLGNIGRWASGNSNNLLSGLSSGAQMIYNEHAAAQAYDRQNEFYVNHLSMPAKVAEYKAAGLNPMGLSGAGAGATSAPSVSQANTPDIASIIGSLAQMRQVDNDLKLRTAELEIQDKNADTERIRAEAYANLAGSQKRGQDISNNWADQLYLVDLGNKGADIAQKYANVAYLAELCESADVQQELDRHKIKLIDAQVAGQQYQNAILAAQKKYADRYYKAVAEYQESSAAIAGMQEADMYSVPLKTRRAAAEAQLKHMITQAAMDADIYNGDAFRKNVDGKMTSAQKWDAALDFTGTMLNTTIGALAGYSAARASHPVAPFGNFTMTPTAPLQ